jgi:hypothetical protein
MQSFHIEQIALRCNGPDFSDGESAWPWAVNQFFEKAIELTEPSATISTAYSVDDWVGLRQRLESAKESSLSAWYEVEKKGDFETAIGRYRVLFGDKFPAYG